MRPPVSSPLVLLLLLSAWLFACRQPGAELELPSQSAAEPSGRAPSVFVEAPKSAQPATILDWHTMDGSLSALVGGQRFRVDYDADHPHVGATTALCTIVVFSDYQCPYCQRLDEVLDQLLARYPDRLRVVYRQFPLPMHREAEFAASVALAAHAQGGFEPMHQWLFANSRSLSHASVASRAAELGLDAQRLLDEVDGGRHDQRIAADIELGTRFGVTGTPAYFINGREHSGARSLEELEPIVLEELALAEQLIAAGSAPEQVWARILVASSDTLTPPSPASTQRFPTALAGLPQRGAAAPKVEILMCGDFDCPYSKKSTATLEQLLQDHPNEVAVYFRHHPLPMHPNARAAHRAAVAAEDQGKFWEMFDLLYADPKQRSDAELEAMAKQIGLDLKRFRKQVAARATEQRIDEQANYCEQDLDAKGTPTFFINGRKLVGARPLADFEAVIREELAAAP